MPFSALGLSAPLVRALDESHYAHPTPVQAAAIPAVLRGDDVWARAQTGSGKTAAFALPILQHRLDTRGRVDRRTLQALVLVPTRELAAQVGAAFVHYGRHLPEPAKIITAFGGVSINPQLMALRGGADVVVATPGRLLDLVDHNAIRLGTVATLVLDEADRLFELGFADELGRILALLPVRRQNLLFSATYPAAVESLANQLLHEPTLIEVADSAATTPDILERAIEVDVPRRTQLLIKLVADNAWSRVLVFVATKYATEHVSEKLRRAGLNAGALHGELSQGARTKALADFKTGDLQVLVATDLAARGLDIASLPAVVNFDLPRAVADYTHRIGRTGRAGESGVALSFITAESHAHFLLIEKRHGRILAREQIEGFEPELIEVPASPATPPGTGGGKGKRKSKKDKLREAAARAAHPSSAPEPAEEPVPNTFRWHRSSPGRRRL